MTSVYESHPNIFNAKGRRKYQDRLYCLLAILVQDLTRNHFDQFSLFSSNTLSCACSDMWQLLNIDMRNILIVINRIIVALSSDSKQQYNYHEYKQHTNNNN